MDKTIIISTNQFIVSQDLYVYEGKEQIKQVSAPISEINKFLLEELKDKNYNIIIKGKRELYENQLPAIKSLPNNKIKWVKQ